jgi:hypothetical protein
MLAAGVAMALIVALVTDARAQTTCTRSGDRLDCSDGHSYRIYQDP